LTRVIRLCLALYKESPQSCHSSAIAQIAPDAKSINSPAMFAMRRHLKNVKKASPFNSQQLFNLNLLGTFVGNYKLGR
jgi:hypothetical protein